MVNYKQNCQILRIVYRQNVYLEIYPTDTLYIIDREKVDEVLRELFRRIGNGKSTQY